MSSDPRVSESVARWERESLAPLEARTPPRPLKGLLAGGKTPRTLYTPADLADIDPIEDIGLPGEAPFVRGVQPNMYRGRLWTMRQYAGFGSAKASNERYRLLLSRGQTGLSVAFDLPTQMGRDGDHPMALGEVGKVGVAVDTLEDMETLFDAIPLDKVSTSMTINSTAGTLLALSWVQHETGAVLDLPPLRSLLAERGARWALDGVQALGKVAVDVAATGADAVAFSAHKIGGPQGVGALWVRAGASLATVMPGGGQERGLRGGTENLLGIVGFGAAATGVADRLAAMPSVAARRDAVERVLQAHGASPSVALRPRVATVSHVGWAAAEVSGPELVAAFDVEGVSVSSGSACSSGRARASASIARLYPSEPWRASSALRVSLSPETTDAEVARFAEVAARVLPRFLSGVMTGSSTS